jgi:hypothetical protein
MQCQAGDNGVERAGVFEFLDRRPSEDRAVRGLWIDRDDVVPIRR